ncbi:hypothetical protein [Kitasatospora sp. MBT66]|uniref:hypothetical protein n=1 Tax=Kitasatospora sp. MBT66 TaxID=1444769 RepID=UPI0005B844D8|nr:hypothetical protein [Kitasatospora sp. MBT66]
MGQQIGAQGPGKPGTAVVLARAITNLPTKQLAETPVLIAQERDLLVKCEAALENLRIAYWAAGKALEAIRGGRLYRATHGTFEAYCLELWDISPQYAGKLIRAWRVAEKVFESLGPKSNDLETIVSKRLGYGQAWELVALSEEHGVDAAALLYVALIQAKGMALTAAMVAGAAKALPPEAVGKKKATEEAAVSYLASLEGTKQLTAKKAATDPFATLRRATKKLDTGTVQAALERDPAGTRAMVLEVIEALSSSVGIEVEIKAASPESATV